MVLAHVGHVLCSMTVAPFHSQYASPLRTAVRGEADSRKPAKTITAVLRLIRTDDRMLSAFRGSLNREYTFIVFVSTCKTKFASALLNLPDCHIQMQRKMREHYTIATHEMIT